MPDRQRLLSALIALAYLTAMWRREGWPGTLALLVPLAVPLYAGTLSRIKTLGWARMRIDRPTPPAVIRFLGWVLLLIPALVMTARQLRAF